MNKKVTPFKKWRRQNKPQNRTWLTFIQVVGLASALVLLYNGAASLIRLNVSYLENTLIPSQKISTIGTPQAKAFAIDFSRKWLLASDMNEEMHKKFAPSLVGKKMTWPHAERVEQLQVTRVAPTGQYEGRVEVRAIAIFAGTRERIVIELPIRYDIHEKLYQVTAYPVLKRQPGALSGKE
ncbi:MULTISPECIES: hypothetical protein [Aneurinibacillus]|uniref:Conjugative transposon protein TcpC n=1 Tax=Aneurinibacillus thermoaerophilus TaxID=143495 RepID=A0A1G8EVH3_ANETH|nr:MULTISPECIES: hypothetical protein [Aneurinibacillus]AMA73345.1 hypothetical protein ACH33_11095 [Aneurinibacillus sp. XH2]MED0676002.1 hypothetical protein [Aneurinibacillus thermoaerophilus]MED0680548.1 hypothetical protein [Aneurinibacillus thermoaerophilus]MED0736285.1 hypothetical protein [Aneurinibacillus thermoaerophilus]MED0758060.1 hypothetical protein [Aneurinibacillus thermoaerophilus]